jgi:hypothetical protein
MALAKVAQEVLAIRSVGRWPYAPRHNCFRSQLFASDHEIALDVSSSKLYDAVICATSAAPGPPREGWPGMVRELHARVGGGGPDDSRGGNGVVVVVRLRHRTRGRCTCGWVGKRHLMRSSAIVDALLHATQSGCEPAVPLAEWKLVSPEQEPCLRGLGQRHSVRFRHSRAVRSALARTHSRDNYRTRAGIVIARQFAERQTR